MFPFLMDQIAGLNLLADQFTQFSITQRQAQALWIVSIYLKDLQQILMRKKQWLCNNFYLKLVLLISEFLLQSSDVSDRYMIP